MAYRDCPDIDRFIAECRAAGCTGVVLAWREEYGQHPDPSSVRYGRLRLATLLAYADGIILRCPLEDQDRRALRARLESAGLAVEERSRNVV